MIELRNVRKLYQQHVALNNLSLNVQAGQIYGLLGPNGAGKSTTIKLLLGFVRPDAGSVVVGGTDLGDQADSTGHLGQVGYIPEDVHLYPYLTGRENLDYFCQLAGIHYKEAELSEILLQCGLQREAHTRRSATYSKGMRQKVGIAIAYAKHAKVYLLDEPASGLDPSASFELSALLRKLAGEGAAVLMASHDLFRVRETCHNLGILKEGSLVQELPAAQVSSNELEAIYLQSIGSALQN